MFETIFLNKTADFAKLCAAGFTNENGVYTRSTTIRNGQFLFTVSVYPDSSVKTATVDTDTNEEYVLHLMPETDGVFVGQVRAACADVLQKIADDCFSVQCYQNAQSLALMKYVAEKYDGKPEFLWEKFPQYAVYRNQKTNKWYAVLMIIKASKLGLESDKDVEVVDLHVKPETAEKLIDGKTCFAGYHMNKKRWISVLLDGSADFAMLCRQIDDSFALSQ